MFRRLKYDESLFAATIALALFGVVMVYSASAFVAMKESGSVYGYFVRQAAWAVIGFGAMLAGMRIDYRVWRAARIVYPLLGVVVLMLVMVFLFPAINGAHRWIRFGGMSVQPSELSKLALVLFLARFLERRAGEEHDFFRTLAPAISVTGFLIILIVAEPDLGTALILAVGCAAMLFASGARLLHLGLLVMPAIVGVGALLVLVPWRLRRVMSFLDPWADPQGAGYQVTQSLIAVGSGGVSGLGFAEGRQKMLFLPFAHSDFIFAVIGEELGTIGGLAVIALFGVVLWRGVSISLRAPERFGMLLGLGIVMMIVTQALFNMSVTLSMLPTKGIPLPFISYGGSSLVPTLFSIGILLNISQHATGREAYR
ncbi:MAG: putative lipid II flippase FtsW [Pyrinomonadaceae bacterium MAG19_C2-C3]|nr:putative lipid II flippase FtsW [Pyrinomonadaceae bacterium MAG19_C2-C3]